LAVMMRAALSLIVAALCAGGVLLAAEPSKAKPKFTIKEVMKVAIKGDSALVKKACKGTATPEELRKLVEFCKALTEGTPPRGDMESWTKRSRALYEAAVAIEKDPKSPEASLRLENAVECRQCHTPHKPQR
jgi:hypothetical protein